MGNILSFFFFLSIVLIQQNGVPELWLYIDPGKRYLFKMCWCFEISILVWKPSSSFFSQGATSSFQVRCDLKSFLYSSVCNPVPDVYQHYFQISFSFCHFYFCTMEREGESRRDDFKEKPRGERLWPEVEFSLSFA